MFINSRANPEHLSVISAQELTHLAVLAEMAFPSRLQSPLESHATTRPSKRIHKTPGLHRILKMKISFVLQSLVTALFVGQASAFFFRNNEDTTLADAADRLGLNTLVAFATLADEALLPILDRLTGDEPTSKFLVDLWRSFSFLPLITLFTFLRDHSRIRSN